MPKSGSLRQSKLATFLLRVAMDELDEFLDSLETGPSDPSGVVSGDIDLEAEIDDLFNSDGGQRPEGEARDDDSDDEFTLEGVSSNLQKLSLHKSPEKTDELTPVKELVDKYNNPPKTTERALLDKAEIPSSQKKELIPALKERNEFFEVKSTEKSYDGSNVGKIINSNAETSDADFLSWLSSSEGAGSGTDDNQQKHDKVAVVPGRERVTKSALDYIQNLSLEEGMGGGGPTPATRATLEIDEKRMPLNTGLSVDTSEKKATEHTDLALSETDAAAGEGRTTQSAEAPSGPGHGHSPASIKQFFEEMFGEEFAGRGDDDGGERQGLGGGTTTPGKFTPPKAALSPRGGRSYFSRDPGSHDDTFKEQSREYEADLLDLIRSPFPRTDELREALRSGGYIPPSLRGKIWSLMLTGTVQEDHEVAFFQPKGAELPEADLRALASDCDAVLKRHPGLASAGGQTRNDLYDLAVLYCSRRRIPYHPLYTQLLAPMLCLPSNDALSRAQASSCFQALATTFTPVMKIQRTLPSGHEDLAMGHAIDKIHAWTRLLVLYHSPTLAHHLDRVMPGWEKPTRGLSATENEQKRNRNDLDELEKVYGLDSVEEEVRAEAGARRSASPRGIASAAPSKGNTCEGCGLIPLNWICGLFSSSLPSEQGVLILDWAILNNERYAGVYLVAALLEVFAQFLLQMDGDAIRAWTEEVSEGRGDWFKSPSLPETAFGHPQKPLEQHAFQQSLSWSSFVEGWTGATAALRKSTPTAFRQALEETEKWASSKYAKGRMEGVFDDDGAPAGLEGERASHPSASETGDSALFDFSPQKRGALEETQGEAGSSGSSALGTTAHFTINDEEENLGPPSGRDAQKGASKTLSNQSVQGQGRGARGLQEEEDVDKPPTASSGVEGAKTAFMSVGRRVSAFALEQSQLIREKARPATKDSLSTTSSSVGSNVIATAKDSRVWAHDLHSEANTLCLWASAAEVNPCICTSRKPVPVPAVLSVYMDAISISCSGDSVAQRSLVLTTVDAPTRTSGSEQEGAATLSATSTSRARTGSRGSFHDENEDDAAQKKPFYFGIDCRTEAERSLGTFPKALVVDPSFITDPSKITDILAMLEPLAQSVHLCIIGSGEEYIRYIFEQQRLRQAVNPLVGGAFAQLLALGRGLGLGSAESQSELQIESLLREYRLKLNAIALFFLKRSFLHVSILDGGFITAVRALKSRPVTPVAAGSSMPLGGWGPFSSVLVDANEPMIDKILRGEHDTESVPTLQAKASAAAAAVRQTLSSTSSSILSHARANLTGEHNIADTDMDNKAHGVDQSNSTDSGGRSRATSSGGRYSGDHADSTTATPPQASASSSQSGTANNIIGDIGKRFSLFGETVKTLASEKMAEIREAVPSGSQARHGGSGRGNNSSHHGASGRARASSRGSTGDASASKPSFTIEDDDDPLSPGSSANSKSKEEKALAMANHVMAGLKKGDSIAISRETLPGALLFPCTKLKRVRKKKVVSSEDLSEDIDKGDDARATVADGQQQERECGDEEEEEELLVSRFIAVSRERLIVLDSHGKGVGSIATVKSNHHLTQLVKITFKKRDPNLVHLFFSTGLAAGPAVAAGDAGEGSAQGGPSGGDSGAPLPPALREKSYRLSKTKQFVEALQMNMKRFKE